MPWDKGITVEQIYRASQTLRAAGIEVGFFLQFGYPGEGLQEIEQTLKMVRECRPDEIGMSVSYPLPGTRFYESVPPKNSAKNETGSIQKISRYSIRVPSALSFTVAYTRSCTVSLLSGGIQRGFANASCPIGGWRI